MVVIAYLLSGRVIFEYGVSRGALARLLGVHRFDGIVLSDSFLSRGVSYQRQHEHALSSFLLAIWGHRRKSYLFVIAGGGGFSYGHYGDLGIYLAEFHPSDFVWIAMGNALYGSVGRTSSYLLVAQSIIETMRLVDCRQLLIFGGSSSIWHYAVSFDSAFAEESDVAVCAVTDAVRSAGYRVVCAQDYLQGLQLVDRIGHVNWSDYGTVRVIERFFLRCVVPLPNSKL